MKKARKRKKNLIISNRSHALPQGGGRHMSAIRVKIKPLSVNRAFQGRRFKTPEYIAYEREMLLRLPRLKVPKGRLEMYYCFGVSNKNADVGNFEKQTTDILSAKYGFNDKNIYRFVIERVDVKKGEEFVEFEITSFEE